jgi:hypothetical protein
MNWRLRGPGILGALLDAAARGLHELPRVRSERLPRMANFAFWAMACETAFWPADTFLRAYDANRRAAIESVIDKDPVAAFVREIMAGRMAHTFNVPERTLPGMAPRGGAQTGQDITARSLGGCVGRSGIEMAFSRECRAGSRTIQMSTAPGNPRLYNIVSTVNGA